MDLSIIIPVYNASSYLKQCVESITKCAGISVECILVNDGSTDNSLQSCRAVVEGDRRFQVLDKPNGGVSSARNAGLAKASGNYIMFLDADDYLTESAMEIIGVYIKQQDFDFAAFSYITHYENGKEKMELLDIPEDESRDIKKAQKFMYASSVFNACWAKLFSRNIIEKYRITFPEDLDIGEDFMFVLRYFQYCQSVVMSKKAVLHYRQHSESAMRKYNLTKRLEYTQTLYTYNKKAVLQLNQKALLQLMYNYYIRVLTNLFLEFSKGMSIGKLSKAYQQAFALPCVNEFVNNANMTQMPIYKRIECFLLKKHKFTLFAIYFKLKSCL